MHWFSTAEGMVAHRTNKQCVSGAVVSGPAKLDPASLWYHWWARQDSNLQPDRYEREDIDQLRW